MGERTSKKKCTRRIPPMVWVTYLLVCSLILTGVSLARYVTTFRGGDEAQVAAGLVTVTYSDPTELVMTQPPDNPKGSGFQSFAFQVSNENSEVAIQYDLVIELEQPLPNGVTMMLDNIDNMYQAQDGTTFIIPQEKPFKAGTPETREHRLFFIGDYSTINDPSFRKIDISVRAEQID